MQPTDRAFFAGDGGLPPFQAAGSAGAFHVVKEDAMPLYLIRFGYTSEEWAQMVKEPQDRRKTVGPLLEAIGGKLHGLWYAFGDHDGFVLAEAPDNTATTSMVLALTGSGKFRSLSTTVLLTVEETLEALGAAQRIALGRPR